MPSFAGLIGGAMKGAAEGYGDAAQLEMKKQGELDLRKQMAEVELEKSQRLEEFRANLGIDTKKREITELDPLKTQSDVTRTKAVGAAETDVLAGREDALRPGKIKTTRDTEEAKGDAERTNASRYVKDPEARAGVKARAQDSRVAGAGEALSQLQLEAAREVRALQRTLAETTDPAKREALQQRIRDLQTVGASKGDTLAQQVAAARAVLGDMDSTDDQKEAARVFLDTVVKQATEKRGGGGGAPANAPQLARPQSKADYDKLPSGTKYVDPNGNVRTKN